MAGSYADTPAVAPARRRCGHCLMWVDFMATGDRHQAVRKGFWYHLGSGLRFCYGGHTRKAEPYWSDDR